MNYEPDNVIHWIFEKMFDQITFNGRDLLETPYERIIARTFDNTQIQYLIHDLTKKCINDIQLYLSNANFREHFLFTKMKKKLYVQILLDNADRFNELVRQGYRVDYKCYQLISLNNRLDLLRSLVRKTVVHNTCVPTEITLQNDLLFYCCEFGYEEMYFYLRNKNLMPNISVYNKAVLGNSLTIIRDISEYIGLSESTISIAIQANNTEIISYLLDIAEKENIRFSKNLITYPILNCNFELVDKFEKKNMVTWHHELYYSAILSGSLDMMKFIESKIPDLHDNKILDSSRTKKGKASLLTDDTIYQDCGKKYFSHTINYAIQSKSLVVLKYLHQKKYGITPSNFITAIRQGTLEALQYLCESYLAQTQNQLPFYLSHYLSIYSYIPNKLEKAKILYDTNLLSFHKNNLTIDDYRKESTHLQMISETVHIFEYEKYDTDWLMKYSLFFVPIKGYKLNRILLTKIRLLLFLDKEKELTDIFSSDFNKNDQQLALDALFLFGNIEQIKKFYPQINQTNLVIPSTQIIMEIICYGQINKICYLLHQKILDTSLMEKIYPLVTMISDPYMNMVANKMGFTKPNLKFLIRSKKLTVINNEIDKHPEILDEPLDKETIREILLMENIELIKRVNLCGISIGTLRELKDWAHDMDLLEIAAL